MLILTSILSVQLMILLPVGLAVAFRRRFATPWWFFLLGMATFVGSQVYHLPLNNWLSDLGLIGAVAAGDPALLRTALVLGLSAGLSESLARAAGFWALFRFRPKPQRAEAILVGLGHGGIEAMLVGGVLFAATVTSLAALRGVDLAAMELLPEQLAHLEQQMTFFDRSPLVAFLPLVERAIAMTLHVALSLLVWMAFHRRNALYFIAAVLYHSAFDATAVYVAQFIENVWLLEGLFLLLLIPGLALLWRWWPAAPARPQRPQAIFTDLALFGVAVKKELLQQWRSKRALIVGAVFLVFGLGSPLLAYFTPQILSSIEGAEMFADLIPTPSNADALTQYISNITQFGFILALLLGMGAVAGEKEKGTAPMILSKPLPRWAFVLSKFVAQALVYVVAFMAAALGAHYYTMLLFEPFAFGPFMLGNLLLLVWLLAYAAVTLLGSTLARSTSAAAGIALVGAILLLLAGSLPRVGPLMPSGLVAWASQLGVETAVAANGGALALTGVLIILCLVGAVAAFEIQEL